MEVLHLVGYRIDEEGPGVRSPYRQRELVRRIEECHGVGHVVVHEVDDPAVHDHERNLRAGERHVLVLRADDELRVIARAIRFPRRHDLEIDPPCLRFHADRRHPEQALRLVEVLGGERVRRRSLPHGPGAHGHIDDGDVLLLDRDLNHLRRAGELDDPLLLDSFPLDGHEVGPRRSG